MIPLSRPVGIVVASTVVLTLAAMAGIHWVITIVALAALAVLALMRPSISVAAVVLSIPVQSEVMLPFVRGEITVTQLTLSGLIIGWGILFWSRRIWLDSVVVGFVLVIAAYVVSFIAVDSPGLWFQETYRWLVAGIFYIICRSVLTEWHSVRLVIWAMLAGVVGVSLMSASQLIVDGASRVSASFGTPNTLAAYLEFTIPVLMACIPILWFGDNDWQDYWFEKWAVVLVSIGGLIVLALTQSRGGYVGILVSCVVIWLHLPMKAKVPIAGVAVLAIGGFLYTDIGQSQFSRFMDFRDDIVDQQTTQVGAGRGAIWATAGEMIADNPLTGVGAGEFDEHYREYVTSWFDREERGQAHNVWLHMGAQAGIWGILGYSIWFFASIWSIITARRRVESRSRWWLVTGVLAVFAAYAVHSLVDYLNVLSLGLQLSVLTAIALNLAPAPLTRYAPSAAPDRLVVSPEVAAACPQ